MTRHRTQLRFSGWKLKDGSVVKSFKLDTGDTVYFSQDQADKYRQLSGYKGKMTPQYDRMH